LISVQIVKKLPKIRRITGEVCGHF